MKLVILMLSILMLSCSSTVSSNDQFTGSELEFKTFISFALNLQPKTIEKLSPEALASIYEKFAEGVGQLPPNSFNSWFQQDQTSSTELDAEVRSELRAMVAKELQASEAFLEGDSSVSDEGDSTGDPTGDSGTGGEGD